ncbi:MAG: HD domain-containing protein [Spirochaetales bacterium]|nr:HD domain-containing protein [Spirochaetales bacterium]
MKPSDKSDELYDYRDEPPFGDSESDLLPLLEDAEEVHELDALDEDENGYYPWSLFTTLPSHERSINILDNSEIRSVVDRIKNSPVPTCLVNHDLRIDWTNLAFLKELIFSKSPVDSYLPELFQTDSELNISAALKRSLENPNNSFSWMGRLLPMEGKHDSTFLRAIIQPCLCEKNDLPKAFLVQCDIITNEYKELLQNTFLSLLEASKLKDNDTGDHIERVNEYSVLLGRNLMEKEGYEEVTEDFIEDISFLAAMHDVGKIGTPDDILNKSGPLDDWEREIMNEHTKNGAYILSTHPKSMAREIALSHHEKWDGSGYPYGIFGEMIPLCARIVCIADVYDALRSQRSYKESFSHEKSVSIMKKGREKHFDPALLDLFLDLHEEFDAIYNSSTK